jgi:hypothetical protein
LRKPSRILLATAAVIVLPLHAAPATADESPAADSRVQRIVVSKQTIDEARHEKNPRGQLAPAEREELAHALVEDAEGDGAYLDEESVDVIPLLDGQVQLAVPADADVNSVTLAPTGEGDDVAVTVDGVGNPADAVSSAGPEMASGWASDGGPWVYNLYLYIDSQRMADADFHAQRWIAKNDGDPGLNYVRYDRWAGAQIYALSGLPDPYLKTMRIQNFPYDSVEPNLHDWVRYKPGADLPDLSSCTDTSVSFTWQGIGATRNYTRCDTYNMWRNIDKPSSYWLQYQGHTKGNREAAYTLLWSQKQGTSRSQHDLQKLVLEWPSWAMTSDSVCTQTDASKTCRL